MARGRRATVASLGRFEKPGGDRRVELWMQNIKQHNNETVDKSTMTGNGDITSPELGIWLPRACWPRSDRKL